MKILVAEDEMKMQAFIIRALQEEGFTTVAVSNGEEALAAVMEEPFDVVIMDIMMPGPDGVSILKQYREKGGQIPVLLVSARGQVTERVEGLNAGADDYLTKPFAIVELIARVKALSRRAPDASPLVVRVADLSLDTVSREIKRGNNSIYLSPREFRLLEFLMKSAGRVRGRMAILEAVWDCHFDPGTNLVDVCLRRLREKVDKDFEPKLLQTVKGVGYMIRKP